MVSKWKATNKVFGRWHVVKASRRLMTLKKVTKLYKGKPHSEMNYLVRFFNSRATAVREAQRLNAGGSLRNKDM